MSDLPYLTPPTDIWGIITPVKGKIALAIALAVLSAIAAIVSLGDYLLARSEVDWWLALALLVAFPLAIPIYRSIRTLMGQALRDLPAADADGASRVVEYVQGLPVLRSTNQVGQQSQRLQTSLLILRSICRCRSHFSIRKWANNRTRYSC